MTLSLSIVIASERLQLSILVGLSIGIVLLTTTAYALDRQLFTRFLGQINPILASIAIVLAGGSALIFFDTRDWFAIYTPLSLGRIFWPAVIASVLAGLMILVDTRASLPEDINAPFPYSLLFYPVVGYAAEILFHVLPLFILLTASSWLLSGAPDTNFLSPYFIMASFIEPLFQVRPLAGKYPTWAAAYVFLNVWVINLVGLWLFNSYDFVTMYAFRLMYYLPWHIVWGNARLRLLF